jgi:acylphosphatase
VPEAFLAPATRPPSPGPALDARRSRRQTTYNVTRMTRMVVRRHVIIHGRVQGVFFRGTARDRAHAHGVAGWVRNRPDGAVEAVFEGAPEAVDRLVRFCEMGPPGARVARVEVIEEEPEGLSGFGVG